MKTPLITTMVSLVLTTALLGQQVYPDLPYGPAGERNKLDIYLPLGATGPLPCVVWIHGGGWWGGARQYAANDAAFLNSLGFAVASISYRLSGHAPWPAQIHDCKGAVRWLRAHAATYDLDPDRFIAFGESAGGHLAAMLGTSGDVAELEGVVGGNLEQSSRVQAVVDFSAEVDILAMPASHLEAGSRESTLIGMPLIEILALSPPGEPSPWLELVHSTNPGNYATPDDPPFYVAHGDVDPVIPPEQSEGFVIALANAQVPVEYHVIPGGLHGLSSEVWTERVPFLLRSASTYTLPGGTPLLDVPSLIEPGHWGELSLTGGTPGAGFALLAAWEDDYVSSAIGDILIPLTTAGLVASGTLDGAGSWSLPFPAPAALELTHLNVYFQAAAVVPGTSSVLATTNLATTHLMP